MSPQIYWPLHGIAESALLAGAQIKKNIMATIRAATTAPMADIWAPRLLSVFRAVAALLFLSHGIVKLFGFPAGAQPGVVPLISLGGLAALLEVFGGGAILLGAFTRPIAFVLSGQMAVAYFMVHAPQGFFPVLNGGEAAILYCFSCLYLSAAGAGSWSIDHLREGKHADLTIG